MNLRNVGGEIFKLDTEQKMDANLWEWLGPIFSAIINWPFGWLGVSFSYLRNGSETSFYFRTLYHLSMHTAYSDCLDISNWYPSSRRDKTIHRIVIPILFIHLLYFTFLVWYKRVKVLYHKPWASPHYFYVIKSHTKISRFAFKHIVLLVPHTAMVAL